MRPNWPLLVLPILLQFTLLYLHFTDSKRQYSKPGILEQYQQVLPKSVYEKLRGIYLNRGLKPMKKLALLDALFTTLPDALLRRLPTPSAFRALPDALQRRLHSVYYNKRMAFGPKIRRMEQILAQISDDQRKRIPRLRPIRPIGDPQQNARKSMPSLVEFDVPVLLRFNGHLETHLLRAYLPSEDFDFLSWLESKRGLDEMNRARLVGVLLKLAYRQNPDNFPLPLSGDSRDEEITEDIRNLGVRLMFGQNPFDRVDPAVQNLLTLKRMFSKTAQQGQQQQQYKKLRKQIASSSATSYEGPDLSNNFLPSMDCAEHGQIRIDQLDLFPMETNVVAQQQQQPKWKVAAQQGMQRIVQQPNRRMAPQRVRQFAQLWTPKETQQKLRQVVHQPKFRQVVTSKTPRKQQSTQQSKEWIPTDLLAKLMALFNGTLHWDLDHHPNWIIN